MTDNNLPENSVKPSKFKPDGFFAFVTHQVHDRINNELGATKAALGTAVYIACGRIAFKAKSKTFTCTIQQIAGFARLSYPTTKQLLDLLETEAKVISIERGQRKKGDVKQPPHRYTLLSTRRNAVKPARRKDINSADETDDHHQNSEILKDSSLTGREKNKPTVVAGDTATQSPATVGSSKTIWEGECN